MGRTFIVFDGETKRFIADEIVIHPNVRVMNLRTVEMDSVIRFEVNVRCLLTFKKDRKITQVIVHPS